jgi:hypothetical protein
LTFYSSAKLGQAFDLITCIFSFVRSFASALDSNQPVCTQLLVSASPSEENVSQFVALLERCYSHEAFTQQHRRRIASWKEQAHRIWNMLPVLGTGAAAGTGNGNSNSGPGRNNKSSDSRFARRSNIFPPMKTLEFFD